MDTMTAALGRINTVTACELSVIIPAYNEEGAILETVRALRATLDEIGISYEIVAVNDGSTDNTLAQARLSGARVIDQPGNIGYGAALKAGILSGSSEYVAIIDADGTYPADALPTML